MKIGTTRNNEEFRFKWYRRLIKIGKSLGITLPIDLVRAWGLEEGMELIITLGESGIVLRKRKEVEKVGKVGKVDTLLSKGD